MVVRDPAEGSRGQVLAIFAGGLIALILGVAIVIDGGNAMAQQRGSQNGADAASEAGTVVIAQYLMGGASNTGAVGTCPKGTADPWDSEVCKAVYGSAAANGVKIDEADYVDFKGDPLGPKVGGGTFPTAAQGVRVHASKDFPTYFARVAGFDTLTATTLATAVTGQVNQVCAPGSGCGLFPITVPYVVSNCDGNGTLTPGVGDWPYLGDADTSPANEAIVPLCKDKNGDIGGGSAGSVGWLDYSTALGVQTTGACANNFKDAITAPCVAGLPFPTWIQTFTGGVGKGGPAIEDALNSFHNSTVQIPLFDGTCKVQPGGTALDDCPPSEIGVGVNTWYHIPTFASFKMDFAYINGGNRKACQELPGAPFVSGNGANGCLKGWWVVALPTPGGIITGPVSPSTSNQLGVMLIR